MLDNEPLEQQVKILQASLISHMRRHLIQDAVHEAVEEFTKNITEVVTSRVEKLTVDLVRSYYSDINNCRSIQITIKDSNVYKNS